MKSSSKAAASGCERFLRRTGLHVAIVACTCLIFNGLALAGPKGGKVTGGKGSIAREGTTTNVQQLTERMSVEWQSFDLGRKDSVNFLQPDSSSLVLNHILQNGPSQIDGRINANGHVLLINPRGVIFGENSIINVGALTASTLWMNKDDFLNGDMVLKALDDSKGVVVNSGLISAASGGVTLLGEGVSNEGLITAELGYVNLVSGREAYLTFDEEGFLGVKVTEDVVENLLGEDSNVENSGEISATGGKVIMSANVSRGLFDSAVNNSGIIAATGFDDVPGGTVHLLGDTVAVTEGARISVDGDSGGGEILVGGDYQGANPDVDNAQFTRVARDTVLSANALESGDGGKVIVWADDTTLFRGEVSARGGTEIGDGGFAEVSGKQTLQFLGAADLSAINGVTGTLLLDPGMITVSDGLSPLPDPPPDPPATELPPSGGSGAITDGHINELLETTSLEIKTANVEDSDPADEEKILFEEGVVIEWNNSNTLTFTAGKNITFVETSDGVPVMIDNSAAPINEEGTLVLQFGASADSDEGGILDLNGVDIEVENVLFSGLGDNDEIIGQAAADDFVVNMNNGGTVNTWSFENVENLNGGAGTDIINLEADVMGTVDGGDDADTFNLSAGVTVGTLTGGMGAGPDGEDKDTLVAVGGVDPATNEWEISGDGIGTLNSQMFSEMENLTGNALEDNFTVLAAGTLEGSIDGDGGKNSLDVSAVAAPVTVDLEASSATGLNSGGPGGFSNIDVFAGGGAGFTLVGPGGGAEFTTAGENDGAIDGEVTYTDFANLKGGSGSDEFNLGHNVTGTVDGGGDNDEINVTAVQSGSVSGGAGNDTINLEADVMGAVDGGDDGDEINVTVAQSGSVSGGAGTDIINLEANVMGAVDGGDDADTFNLSAGVTVGTLTGGMGAGPDGEDKDTLVAVGGVDPATNEWEISGDGIGTLNSQMFSEMENLTGNALEDNFTVLAAGTLEGSIDGDGGKNSLDVSAVAAPVTVDLEASSATGLNSGGPGGFSSIDVFAGGGAGFTLVGPGGGAEFTTAGENDGAIDGEVTYTDFANLKGGSGSDEFNLGHNVTGTVDGGGDNDEINVTAVQSGSVSGGAGNDTINLEADVMGAVDGGDDGDEINVTVAQSGSVSGGAGTDIINLEADVMGAVDGGDDADTFNLSAGVTVGTLTGGMGAGPDGEDKDTLVAVGGVDPATNEWEISGDGIGTLNSQMFSEMENLTGNALEDNFTVLAAGTLEGSIDGDGGKNSLDVSAVAAPVTVDLEAGSATGLNSGGPGGFSNIDVFAGGGAGFTLVGPAGGATFTTTGENDGTVGEVDYEDFASVTGGPGVDTFNLEHDVMGTVDGGAASDTFNVNAALSGSVLGGTGNDTFNLTLNVAGMVDGGAGDDQFNLTRGVTVGALAGVDGGAGTDELIAVGGMDPETNEWEISGVDSGTLNGQAFSRMENLTGNALDDNFTVLAAGALSGSIDGVDGADAANSLNLLAVMAPVTVNLEAGSATGLKGGAEGGFSNIDAFTGGGAGFTLVGPAGGATFTTTGENDGTVGEVDYEDFASVTGGPGVDTFNLEHDVTGTVDGGAASDTFNVNAALSGSVLGGTGNDTFNLTLNVAGMVDGGAGDDQFNLTRGVTVGALAGVDGGAGTDELIAVGGMDPETNEWEISGVDSGTLNGQAFSRMENLTGDASMDTFNFSADLSGTASGADGNDTFTLDGGFVSIIDGGNGSEDKLVNDGSGIQLNNQGGFFPISGVVGLVSQVEVVTNTVDLIGTGGSETFLFIDDPVHMEGVQVMPPESGIRFFNVENLNGGGGDDGIDANNKGVQLIGNKFKIFGFDILVEGFSTVSRVDVLTGDDRENEAYSLNGTTATVDTQKNGNTSTSFLGVTNLRGGGGSDTLNNNGRGVTLSPPGFVTGGGVTVSQIEEVTSTGNLTGSAASEIFTLTGGDVSVVPPGASISFSGVENLDGGPGLDTLIGSSEYVIESENGGSAGTRRFSSMENLQSTPGNDTFTNAGGSLSGSIDGLEQEGGEGDRLVGFSTYNLNAEGTSTANDIAFENIESLTGTDGGDDSLEGVNEAVLTEANGGTVNDYFFHDIENLAGTAGNDSFTRAGGSLSGSINGREGGDDILVGFNNYVLTGLNQGTANGTDFSGIENLRGTAGNDTFRKANSSGLLEGLIQGEGEDPNSDGDELLDFVNYSILGVGSGIADGTEYEGIESISATGSGSLQGSDGPNTFILDGPDSGTVDDIAFSGFANLEGLGGDDVFQRKDDGALSGTIDGGDDDDRIEGFTAYILSGQNSGTADDTNFLNVENLWGTTGNDSFTNDGGSLTGIINGLEQAGGPVDQLIGFSRYDLGTGGLPTADDIRFENIESLVGTPGDGDRLVGGSAYEVTGRNSGNVNGSFSFSEIEHLEGTSGDDTFDIINGSIVTLDGLAGDDRFVLEGGVVTGTVIGGEGIDEIVGANLYALTEDNKGVASLVDANGNTTSSAPFETVESLVGTSGSDTFNLGGYTLSGTIDGLGDSTTDGPGLVIDRVIFVQDQESQGNIGILVTEDGDPATDGNGYIGFGLSSDEFENAGTDAFQLRYVGIEDFLLMLERDLNIKGIGTISSSADIEVKGSLNMYGPASSDPALTLDAGQNITIQQNLLAKGKSIIDVSTTGTVLTIGGSVSIDTASGAEINGLVSVTITEEPVIQIEVEETTSLSIFGKVDIFPAGRNSVARQSDENELSSEDEFIEALRAAEPVY